MNKTYTLRYDSYEMKSLGGHVSYLKRLISFQLQSRLASMSTEDFHRNITLFPHHLHLDQGEPSPLVACQPVLIAMRFKWTLYARTSSLYPPHVFIEWIGYLI